MQMCNKKQTKKKNSYFIWKAETQQMIWSSKSHESVSLSTGAQCESDGGRASDGGGHGRPRTLHPCQRVGAVERTCAAQLEQPDLHPIPPGPGGQVWLHPAALPG